MEISMAPLTTHAWAASYKLETWVAKNVHIYLQKKKQKKHTHTHTHLSLIHI